MKRSPLPRRKSELKRGTPPARVTRLSARSKRREAEAADRFVIRSAVFARDHWACTMPTVLRSHGAHPLDAGPCVGPITPHHLRKASAGGPYTLENLTTLCAGHNGWVEDHPLRATELGLVIR
jgi:hypothetical protein